MWARMILVFILVLWLFGCPASVADTTALPQASDGVLDLRQWSLPAPQYAPIRGEWRFYWNRLLSPGTGDGQPLPAGSLPLSLEHPWLGLEINGVRIPGQGFASYSLDILPPLQIDAPLAIELPAYRRAYELWVNSELLARSGTLSRTGLEHQANFRQQVIPLPPGQTRYRIVLHSSNHLTWLGATPQPTRIGTLEALNRAHSITLASLFIALGVGLGFGLKYLILFAMRCRYRGYLWLGLLALNIAAHEAGWLSLILPTLLPLDAPWMARLLLFTLNGLLPLYALLAQSFYPQTHPPGLLRAVLIPHGLALALCLFGPIESVLLLILTFAPYALPMHLALTLAAWRSAREAQRTAWLLFAAILMITVFAFHDFLWNSGLITGDRPLLFNLAGLLLLLAVLFDHYEIDNFEQVQRLSATLQARVAERTADLSEKVQELEHKEQELIAACERAERANRSKSQFLAAASHDLRQPLHAMSLQIGQLQQGLTDPDEQTLLAQIGNAQTALSETLNALLDISRMDSCAITPHGQHFPLQNVFTRIADEFTPQAMQKGLTLRVRSTVAWVYSDPVLLYRVLANLTDNAIKYGLAPGVVLGARRRSDGWSIEIQDTGPGIPAADQEKVFEEFVQLRNPGRDRRQGLGLGLSIVQRLCLLLDHPLILAERSSRGLTVRIQVPAGQPQLTGLQEWPMSDHIQYSLRGCVVLVIEDAPAVLQATRALLATWGCAVIAATGLEEALALAQDEDLDVIIADYTLSDSHSGLEAIAAINQALGKTHQAVIVTGEVNPEALEKLRACVYPVLGKPVSPMTLRSTLHRLLRPAIARSPGTDHHEIRRVVDGVAPNCPIRGAATEF